MPGIEDAPREISRSAFSSASGSVLKRNHPMLVVAAGAITVFCAIGVGVMTGLIPSAQSGSGYSTALAPSSAAQAAVGNLSEAAVREVATPTATHTPSKKPSVAPHIRSTSVATKPTPTYTEPYGLPGSGSERAITKPQSMPPVAMASNTTATAAPCNNCGVVESVNTVTHAGNGSGAGAVLGGLVGGLLGRQVGGGRGKDVATVAGAVGGAVLGNHIEKERKSTQDVEIRVRLDDGTTQTIRGQTDQGLRIGDKIRLDNGRLIHT